MRLERIDPDDGDVVRACHAVLVAARAADDPVGDPADSLQSFSARLAGRFGEPTEGWYVPTEELAGLSGSGGGVAGWYGLQFPDLENRDRAFLVAVVRPELRRRGLGRELIDHAKRRAAAEGRAFIDAFAVRGSAGEAFARRLGAEAGIAEARRILDLRKVPAERFAELRAAAEEHAAGYSLVSWTGVTPEHELARVAGIHNTMNDAPREEGWFEDDVWDAERVRTRADVRIRFGGSRGYSVGAVHEKTGDLAALTQVMIDPEHPAWGRQRLTAVTRAHRGHRLGLLIKATMLSWLVTAEPQLERIETGNAAANSYMIAVNEALGYELAEPSPQFFALPVS
jgi:ribosomal protein S18 acetylase RimI-like enzyme/RimJ/RimL family protein N-acetyltransferase